MLREPERFGGKQPLLWGFQTKSTQAGREACGVRENPKRVLGLSRQEQLEGGRLVHSLC
jgi:hypothetical protein